MSVLTFTKKLLAAIAVHIAQCAYISSPLPVSKLSSALASECIEDVHEPSVCAELTSHNSLTTSLLIFRAFFYFLTPPR